MEFRDLKAQYRALQPEMDRAILETVAGAGFIGGARVKALEERLAAYVGVKHRPRGCSICSGLYLFCLWRGSLLCGRHAGVL